jgi:hypothetical protein
VLRKFPIHYLIFLVISRSRQAARRTYRFGQTKPTFVYRLVAADTLEAVVFDRLVAREALAARVIDAHNAARLFRADELADLFRADDTALRATLGRRAAPDQHAEHGGVDNDADVRDEWEDKPSEQSSEQQPAWDSLQHDAAMAAVANALGRSVMPKIRNFDRMLVRVQYLLGFAVCL